MFGILRILPFVFQKGNDVNSDWLADQWDERSVFGHAQFHKGRIKGDDPEIDTAQTPKLFDRRLALLGKTRKTFTDSIPNNCAGRYFGECSTKFAGAGNRKSSTKCHFVCLTKQLFRNRFCICDAKQVNKASLSQVIFCSFGTEVNDRSYRSLVSKFSHQKQFADTWHRHPFPDT